MPKILQALCHISKTQSMTNDIDRFSCFFDINPQMPCGLPSRWVSTKAFSGRKMKGKVIALKTHMKPPRATAGMNSRQERDWVSGMESRSHTAALTTCDRRRRDFIALFGCCTVDSGQTAQAVYTAPGLSGFAPAAEHFAPALIIKRLRRRLLNRLKLNRDSFIICNFPAYTIP